VTSFSAQLPCRLRFKHLTLLVALDKHRNLHRAADAVHLAQPSATKLIRDLERLFGFRLFERLPRGMEPTELGNEVVTLARRLLEELERFAQHIDNKRNGGCGQLVVGAAVDVGPDVVPRSLSALKHQYPLLSVKLLSGTSDEIVGMLMDRKLDLALGTLGDARQCSVINFEALGQDPLCVVARKNHPLDHGHRLALSVLGQSAWILQSQTHRMRQIINQEFERAGLMTPQNVVECASPFSTLRLLLNSDAVAVLPHSAVFEYLRAGLLAQLPVVIHKGLVGFGVLSRRDEPLNRVATEFIELLRQHNRSINGQAASHEGAPSGISQKARLSSRGQRGGPRRHTPPLARGSHRSYR
jgi:DNA-binding transcriptional LysR family regulator